MSSAVDPRRLFRESEITRLYRVASRPRDQIALRLLFELGVRREALRTFRLENYDDGLLRFDWKGGGGHELPAGDELRYLLDHHKTTQRVGYLLYPEKVRGFAHNRRVIWEDRNSPLSTSGIQGWWTRLLEQANVDHRRMHDARHTGITRFLRATGNLKLAQMLAGHKSAKTTADIYSHLDLDDLAEAMRVVPAIGR